MPFAGSGFARRPGANRVVGHAGGMSALCAARMPSGARRSNTCATACLSQCNRGARDEYGRSKYKNNFTHCWTLSALMLGHERSSLPMTNRLTNDAFHVGTGMLTPVKRNQIRMRPLDLPAAAICCGYKQTN